ncbi:MMPL family transporter [Gordonia sp. ABSL11-1]|uniref:MMPL family transporter n=1 Tax=Gordonia sp. ABSL11-1 TaxID=3053924 RepID=UPI002573F2FD|nr:MMPL family transporter [Gordonia sp. ABSL11-1]MDL9948856.1 MMPL family transporter [Gordonia sp. ABSL11-1]
MHTSVLYRIGHASASHPFRALVGFAVALGVLLGLASAVGGQTQENWDVTGTPSQTGIEMLREHVPGAGNAFARVVVHSDDGALSAGQTTALRERLTRMPHVATVDEPRLSADRDTAVITVGYDVPVTDADLMGDASALENAIEPSRADGLRVEMNGSLPETAAAPIKGHAEIIGVAIALLIMVFAFGSVVAAGLPIASAVGGLIAGSAGVTLLAAVTDVSPTAPMVASMVGLGVGIDYALLVVSRHVEFVRRGHAPIEAAARSVATAGRSAVFAATTVLVSLMGLRLAGLPTYSSFGFATAIAVVAMLAATLLVVPALCRLTGDRILPRTVRHARSRDTDIEVTGGQAGRLPLTARWATTVGARPVASILIALIVMLTLAAPAVAMRTWPQDSGAQSSELTTRQAHDLLAAEFGAGANADVVIVAPTDRVGNAALTAALDEIRDIPGVVAVASVARSPDAALDVVPVAIAHDPAAAETGDLLDAIRADLPSGAILTGYTAYLDDISSMLAQRMWVVIGFVVAASVLLLMVVFRSVVIPLKAAFMNLLSVAAAFGVITMVFQWGWGLSLLGVDHPVAVSSWVPILVFAILFGLSMDYEVFLLSRIREEWLATGDARDSVIHGLAKTGRVITTAAAIMVAVFLSFASETDIVLKMMGLGMAVAVLLDATLIRMVLVPATMALLGRLNWWLPAWLDRILPHVGVEATGFDDGGALRDARELAPARPEGDARELTQAHSK